MNDKTSAQPNLAELASQLVSSYVANNAVAAGDLTKLISEVHSALRGLGSTVSTEAPELLVPAVPVRKSVTPDFLVCLEDGKKFKALKRHLKSKYDLTPDRYRAKWELPSDYPMVAPNYSAARSAMAKSNGLGRKIAPEATSRPARKKLGLKFT
ncbi:MucR family transcriptional regulator [Devosia riboflavina]